MISNVRFYEKQGLEVNHTIASPHQLFLIKSF
jgi:hypothetical protein